MKTSKILQFLKKNMDRSHFKDVIKWANPEDLTFSYVIYDNRGRAMESNPIPDSWKQFYEAYDKEMNELRCLPDKKGYYTDSKVRFHNALKRLEISEYLEKIQDKKKIGKYTSESIYKIKSFKGKKRRTDLTLFQNNNADTNSSLNETQMTLPQNSDNYTDSSSSLSDHFQTIVNFRKDTTDKEELMMEKNSLATYNENTIISVPLLQNNNAVTNSSLNEPFQTTVNFRKDTTDKEEFMMKTNSVATYNENTIISVNCSLKESETAEGKAIFMEPMLSDDDFLDPDDYVLFPDSTFRIGDDFPMLDDELYEFN